ncbi:MAG TPA: hypothetical protein VGR97_08020 [Candidatus Acidoferrales bacterium]|nr:hypothetical protein [Candidatus Acidoferrales bacterium]
MAQILPPHLFFRRRFPHQYGPAFSQRRVGTKSGPTSIFPRLLLVLVALTQLSPPSLGQQDSKKAPATPLEAVLQLNLPHHAGIVPVYYSSCCRERAFEIQNALESFASFYKEKLGIASDLSVAVLDESDWKRVSEKMPPGLLPNGEKLPPGLPPYGMTNVQPPPLPRAQYEYVAFIPTDDQGVITQNELADRPYATAATLRIFASAHLTYDDAARRFILHPAYHEVGHTLVRQYGIEVPNHWLNEMLASYFAYAYEKARDRETATIVEGFTKMSSPPIAYTSLEDFEAHPMMDTANYTWYQWQFESRIGEVYRQQGLGFLAKVRTAFPKGTPDISVPDTVARLEAISPGFQAWAKALSEHKSKAVPSH